MNVETNIGKTCLKLVKTITITVFHAIILFRRFSTRTPLRLAIAAGEILVR